MFVYICWLTVKIHFFLCDCGVVVVQTSVAPSRITLAPATPRNEADGGGGSCSGVLVVSTRWLKLSCCDGACAGGKRCGKANLPWPLLLLLLPFVFRGGLPTGITGGACCSCCCFCCCCCCCSCRSCLVGVRALTTVAVAPSAPVLRSNEDDDSESVRCGCSCCSFASYSSSFTNESFLFANTHKEINDTKLAIRVLKMCKTKKEKRIKCYKL